MRWNPSLATGNEVVDREHKELIALIDRLELTGNGPEGSGIQNALDDLTAYVFVHFQMEEKLMRREGYPDDDLQAHLAEHRELDLRTSEFVRLYEAGELTSVQPIVDFLYEWLNHHIQEVDKEMAAFVRGKHGEA
jgi:hemerythrin-like metal-binding protein